MDESTQTNEVTVGDAATVDDYKLKLQEALEYHKSPSSFEFGHDWFRSDSFGFSGLPVTNFMIVPENHAERVFTAGFDSGFSAGGSERELQGQRDLERVAAVHPDAVAKIKQVMAAQPLDMTVKEAFLKAGGHHFLDSFGQKIVDQLLAIGIVTLGDLLERQRQDDGGVAGLPGFGRSRINRIADVLDQNGYAIDGGLRPWEKYLES